MSIGEEMFLPVNFRQEKKYIGKLVCAVISYVGQDLGRVHDWTYHGDSVLHILQDGRCPSCSKNYLKDSFLKSPVPIDAICECEKHWIYVEPQGEYQGSTIVRVFEIIQTVD